MTKIYYIADEKMYCFDGTKTSELPSTAKDMYLDRLYRNAQAREWKTGGSGAMFTQSFDPYSAEDRIQNVTTYTDCILAKANEILFTQTTDGISGLYIKREGSDDGIVFSDNTSVYTAFDLYQGEIAIAVECAGESHIGICPENSVRLRMLTEGESLDTYPAWSRFEDGIIYYSSSGFAIESRRQAVEKDDPSPTGRMMAAQKKTSRRVGPTALYRLDIRNADIRECFSDDRFDYLRPRTDRQGNLYFIKKPYQATHETSGTLGCLVDTLLFPFRLIGALLGFLNIFSMIYSGKALHRNQGSAAKNKDEKSIYLDGNMINAEKELKNNRKKGDRNPGIVPRSYELCCASPSGEITVLKKGVIAYTLANDGIYYSNGSMIIHLDQNGNETLITKAERVTQLSVQEDAI